MEDYILDDSLFEELIKKDSVTGNRRDSHLASPTNGFSEQINNVHREDSVRSKKVDDNSVSERKALFNEPVENEERKKDIVEDFVKWLIKERFVERVYTKYRSTIWEMDKETENKLNRSIILEEDINQIGVFQEIFANGGNRILTASVIKYFKRYKSSQTKKLTSMPIEEKKQVAEKQAEEAIAQKQIVPQPVMLPEFSKWLAEDGFFENIIEEYVNILVRFDRSVALSSGDAFLAIKDYKKITVIADVINNRRKLTNKERAALKYYASYLKQL